MKRDKSRTSHRNASTKHPSTGFDPALQVYKSVCKRIGTAYSMSALAAAETGDFATIAKLDLNPAEYNNHYEFGLDYFVYSYLRKYRGFPSDKTVLEIKLRLDLETIEAGNRIRNDLFRTHGLSRDAERVLSYTRRKIQSVLGDFTYGKVLPGCEWGPGATASLPTRMSALDNKILEQKLSVTPRCLRYAQAYLEHDWHWREARGIRKDANPHDLLSEFVIVPEGRFTSVEKSVNSLREIEIQPTFNLFLQKGVGKFIRRQLQKNGVDLDDQGVNQSLAGVAQACGFATIDLKNASNTVVRELIKACLPWEWYDYLDDLRTHFMKDGERVYKLERFSAMGNGFTFELESLIFWALCLGIREICRDDNLLGIDSIVAVYGDDIIVDQGLAAHVVRLFPEFGFTINLEKSFLKGRFYESCGKHYFDGVDVTPCYQKEELATCDAPSLVRAANRLLYWSSRMGSESGVYDAIIRSSHSKLLRASAKFIPVGPVWVDGEGFVKDPLFRPSRVDKHGSFFLTEYVTVPVSREADHSALLATYHRRFSGKPDLAGMLVRSSTRVDFVGPLSGSELYSREAIGDRLDYLDKSSRAPFDGVVMPRSEKREVLRHNRVVTLCDVSVPAWGVIPRQMTLLF